jgi:alpha-mannosidase II
MKIMPIHKNSSNNFNESFSFRLFKQAISFHYFFSQEFLKNLSFNRIQNCEFLIIKAFKFKNLIFIFKKGWLKTFDEYFETKTRSILDTVVNALSESRDRKFVWAETSYLYLWWAQSDVNMKNKMRALISNGQLEIVTGGWVMNDEANSHYYSMIEQMVQGHEWLRLNVDAKLKPHNGWSIDPFGYSPTMAYLLKQMGFEHMLIQRVHYRVKKELAQNKQLEFKWRQTWSRDKQEIFTHVMPFYSYDVPHTCGPDPKICCQFDFKRLSEHGCPWGVPPQPITDANVEERASTILDQWRKKSELYKSHNVVLIPLGDDFRYTSMNEAKLQFENYDKLIKYMNSRADWNVNASFGTLNDYFSLVDRRQMDFPTLTGDFFTYADRQDHYWSVKIFF